MGLIVAPKCKTDGKNIMFCQLGTLTYTNNLYNLIRRPTDRQTRKSSD